MNKSVVVIGAGLSGLTSASLLAKRGFNVTIVDAQYKPGGSCGIFKRKDNIFEQGSAMLYGFGEKGFNSHRFVFNSLEEPINIIKHDELYVINYGDKRIVFDDMKKSEIDRIINVLEKRFPKIKENICHVELSTPTTLNRYAMKYKGAVAGPKQKLGQHMLKRLHTESEIDNLYNCGESTVMGTGTPAVTVSGISAANMILRKLNMEEYEYTNNTKEYVNIISNPVTSNKIIIGNTYEEKKITRLASECQYCEHPVCERNCKSSVPIRDINRRLAVGNYYGAKRLLKESGSKCKECYSIYCEKCCIRNSYSSSVKIKDIMELLENL